MFKWFLNWLEKHGRKSVIMDRDDKAPYLIRYYALFPDSVQRERKDIPFNILIHQFMQSDVPTFHDHPWSYFTIVLKGGYWEHTPQGTFWRKPGSFRFNRGSFHWIEIPEPGKTWTLFFRGKTKRDWGFLVNTKWIKWDEYLNLVRKA